MQTHTHAKKPSPFWTPTAPQNENLFGPRPFPDSTNSFQVQATPQEDEPFAPRPFPNLTRGKAGSVRQETHAHTAGVLHRLADRVTRTMQAKAETRANSTSIAKKDKEEADASSEPTAYEIRPGEISYGHFLAEAIQLLEQARRIVGNDFFGRVAKGTCQGTTPTVESKKYDTKYWRHEVDCNKPALKLVLKEGVEPSKAIDEMFGWLRAGVWRFDCAEYLQVADWYAKRHAMGAKAFNEKMKLLGPVELKPHGSTGIFTRELYRRNSPEDTYFYRENHITQKTEPTNKTEKQLLAAAPVGSRVTWTNKKSSYHILSFSRFSLKY